MMREGILRQVQKEASNVSQTCTYLREHGDMAMIPIDYPGVSRLWRTIWSSLFETRRGLLSFFRISRANGLCEPRYLRLTILTLSSGQATRFPFNTSDTVSSYIKVYSSA